MPQPMSAPTPSNSPLQHTPQGAEDDEISLLDLLQVLADNLRLLLLGPLAAGLLGLGISFAIPPTFTATTKFMPPPQQQSGAAAMLQSLGALGGLAGAAAGGIKNPADQYVAFVKSRSVQDALVDRFGLMARYDTQYREDARQELEANVLVASGKDGLISLSASDTDPTVAAQLANAHLEELGKLMNRLAVTEAQQRRLFFEKQLGNAKDNLAKAELALKATGISGSTLKVNPAAAVEGLAKLKATIAAQEIKLGSMRGYLAESAPDFKQAQTELAAMRNQMGKAEMLEPAGGNGVNGSDSDYISKFREFKYQETLFELFAKQYEMARVDESREGAVIQVVDTALPPERKAKPKKALIALMAILISGFMLLLFVFARHSLRASAQDPDSKLKLTKLRQTWTQKLKM